LCHHCAGAARSRTTKILPVSQQSSLLPPAGVCTAKFCIFLNAFFCIRRNTVPHSPQSLEPVGWFGLPPPLTSRAQLSTTVGSADSGVLFVAKLLVCVDCLFSRWIHAWFHMTYMYPLPPYMTYIQVHRGQSPYTYSACSKRWAYSPTPPPVCPSPGIPRCPGGLPRLNESIARGWLPWARILTVEEIPTS